jgi:formylglycine-generating enzyme required for sulfatase activity
VRSYPPEAFGLFDMSGNVAEYVEFSCDGKPCPPSGPDPNKPIMGCRWDCETENATEHARGWGVPNYGWAGTGFRCAR